MVRWWSCLPHQWRLSARASQVYSRTDIVCSPPTLFSKKDLHVHHFCESEAFFWHIVHGPAYQQTTHRKWVTTTLDLEKNSLLHLCQSSPRKRLWNFKPLSLINPCDQHQGFSFQSKPGSFAEVEEPQGVCAWSSHRVQHSGEGTELKGGRGVKLWISCFNI